MSSERDLINSPNGEQRAGRPRLAETLIAALSADIRSGILAAGSQLPTEPNLKERFGVSRTVVREAVAELRAAGLIRVVQGAGAFVAKTLPATAVSLTADEARSIPKVLEMLEYRTGVECQAAMLAAIRATPAETFAIRAAQERVEELVQANLPSYTADRDLHLAIAMASHNPLFARSLQSLGGAAIPRSQLPSQSPHQDETYLHSVLEEHRVIVDAIARHSPAEAREAMRAHLENSQRRYEALALASRAAPLAGRDPA